MNEKDENGPDRLRREVVIFITPVAEGSGYGVTFDIALQY